VFDHTSVIRFLEKRFDVLEPNISRWRRAVCGDLTSCFDFKTPNEAIAKLPETATTAQRAGALPGRTTPPTPEQPVAPVQASGVRRSRALPYGFDVSATAVGGAVRLTLRNTGSTGAVLHAYDRLRLTDAPRRYTLEYGKSLEDQWPAGPYDLFVLGPNGFHRRFAGAGDETIAVSAVAVGRKIQLRLKNNGKAQTFSVAVNAYADKLKPWASKLAGNGAANRLWDLSGTSGWYDLTVSSKEAPGWSQRFAGRLDNGQPSISDPAMGGPAVMALDS
jgi:phospholipase C